MARDEALREAEKKIEEARRSGTTKLDLSVAWDAPENTPRLTELPDSLVKLTRLQSLDLSNNGLTTLPEWLGQLTELLSLQVANNQLTTLPDSLGQLTQLRSLAAYNNWLTTMPQSLGQLTQLQSLDLSDNRLTTVPGSLGHLISLQELVLLENQLTSMPESLVELTKLRRLVLGGNRLGRIPEVVMELSQLKALYITKNQLKVLPEWIRELRLLEVLSIAQNEINNLPDSLGDLTNLRELYLGSPDGGNPLGRLSPSIRQLKKLSLLYAFRCELDALPDWMGDLVNLETLLLDSNSLVDLPPSMSQLDNLTSLGLHNNPLNPELAAADTEGLDAIKRYLRSKAAAQVVLNEAKLILVGEGEVGKSCVLGALRGDNFIDGRPTTHGIEIKPVNVTDPDTGTEITLNGWDFGGQRVYRPTHQLFFSAPAVYLVVWKPREGPQQGFVKEWIRLVKHRAPDAKILVVATHGGPDRRQPDLDRQELWDLFGRDMVVDFFLVDSKPDEKTGNRRGIAELKDAIAGVAAGLDGMGRTVPARWQEAREALKKTGAAYLPLENVLDICRKHKMDEDEARDFVRISHRLGHLIHYEHDPVLQDIVVLKPDWLATAISFVLDDEQTRHSHGLVSFSRLGELWNDPARPEESRYDPKLHPLFMRLMERFDLSYRVALPPDSDEGPSSWQRIGRAFTKAIIPREKVAELRYTSLIAQLVPDIRPEQDLNRAWISNVATGDEQQVQICRIVDAKSGQSAPAEGLFYQLIVRLHKFSLGRLNYDESVHWQRGLVLDDDYNGRALLEHVRNDVHITVRAAYPEALLSVLTHEVKWLVENFWEGLRCEVVVPCVEPCGKNQPGTGVFEVQKLIAFKRQGMTIFPCIVSGCNQAQDIDRLLRNAPAARRTSVEQLLAQGFDQMRLRLDGVREHLSRQDHDEAKRFRTLDLNDRRIMSQVEDAFTGLMQTLTDEAKDGPRLFSFQPVDSGFFDKPKWLSQKFRLTLWCEHSRLPLPGLNGEKDKHGVYDLDLARDWFVKAAPFLKVITSTLSLILPVASSVTKLVMDETYYKGIEKELELGNKSIESAAKGMEKAESFIKRSEARDLENDEAVRAQGAILRQLHALLKEKDPSFGGLVRVRNKRQEFLWVHSQFEKEY